MVLTPIEGAVLGRSLGNLLQKGSVRLVTRLRRLKAVNSAFRRSSTASDQAVTDALDDIRTTTGRHGILTEQVAFFIDELAETGLADRIALNAVSGTASAGTMSAFEQLCMRHSSAFVALGDGDTEKLYKTISNMFRASILSNKNAGQYFSRQSLAAIRNFGVEQDRQIAQRFSPRHEDGRPLSKNELIQRMPWLDQRRDAVRNALIAIAQATEPLRLISR